MSQDELFMNQCRKKDNKSILHVHAILHHVHWHIRDFNEMSLALRHGLNEQVYRAISYI